MRQSMTIRLDEDILKNAKVYATQENRTLTNYIETLIKKDIETNQKHDERTISALSKETPVTVFIAEPLKSRLITDPRAGDTPEDVASRQEYLDIVTGFSSTDKSSH